MKNFISDISGHEFPETERVSGQLIRDSLMNLIVMDHPQFDHSKFLAVSELNIYRQKCIAQYLAREIGHLSDVEETVLKSLKDENTITDKLEEEEQVPLSFGQRIADKVAVFGGSWTFIISFGVFILIWICLNVLWLANKAYDPYPFILLNLILSCLAALQAPVIMMSQNRQEEKDRERGKKDYMINLKSELEIRMLHEKIDHLIMHQQNELIEIQKVQIEMMNDIFEQVQKNK